ncbi:MAG: methylmalonyl-CoA carboxyltransferase [Acidimicrobiia bacterium]|nr:methylmalonyl-CoA carboxyltransferase [Acidimicrobiia bacterium]MYC58147.1 methylmalonyl-CoA carboxyltransferase [Acidimicrobiia bacterium]MYG94366.1 methylmalonyl-CoA carboxyltransferase [Acidimicrobiia bacterium]MYI30579.1 methylmalonyl-CoA carboxyltransferase [Acidimicrobiia bacterium]
MTDNRVLLRAGALGTARAWLDCYDGRNCVVFNIEDNEINRGAIGPADSETLEHAAHEAMSRRIPLVGYIASSGADVDAGIAATVGWGRLAKAVVQCSGQVPTIFCATGPAVSGPALLLGLADIVITTQQSYAFVTGPRMVTQFTGEVISNETLGGAVQLARRSGVSTFMVEDKKAATDLVSTLLNLLPAHTDELPPRCYMTDPTNRLTPELTDLLPSSPSGSYDVRDVVRAVVDQGDLLEYKADWATNLICAFATVAGRPVGIVANQPQSMAGTLDISCSQKGARFVSFCNAFNLPLVTFVDTSGFQPGKDLEWRGIIRHGAQLAFAYARASVGRVNVTLRKSYGGAYIVMDSRRMGNDIALAWPSAEIAVMGAQGAVQILHREASIEERHKLEANYEEHYLNPYKAAERGSVDAVIDPAHTRIEVAAALEMLESKREVLPHRHHDNTPL